MHHTAGLQQFCGSALNRLHVYVRVRLNGKTIHSRFAATEQISLFAGGDVCMLVSPAL